MDEFKLIFANAKKENLNFDALVELFGDKADVETIVKSLTELYFDYTRSLLMLDESHKPDFSEIDAELFWLRNVINTFEKVRKPDGRVHLVM